MYNHAGIYFFPSHTPNGNGGTSCPIHRGVWQRTNRDGGPLKRAMVNKWLIYER